MFDINEKYKKRAINSGLKTEAKSKFRFLIFTQKRKKQIAQLNIFICNTDSCSSLIIYHKKIKIQTSISNFEI